MMSAFATGRAAFVTFPRTCRTGGSGASPCAADAAASTDANANARRRRMLPSYRPCESTKEVSAKSNIQRWKLRERSQASRRLIRAEKTWRARRALRKAEEILALCEAREDASWLISPDGHVTNSF